MNSFLWLFSRGDRLGAFFSRRRPLPTTENAEKNSQFSLHTVPVTKKRGITGVARLHNSEPFLELVIMSWIDVFDEILLIDNVSIDTTLEICYHLRERYPEKIKVLSYPFVIAPASSLEHLATDPTSVHSLVYFYRRCFDQASYQLVSKIDDDNLLIHTRADPLQLRHQVLSLSPQTYLTYSGYNISYDPSTDRYMLLDIPHRYSGLIGDIGFYHHTAERYFFQDRQYEKLHTTGMHRQWLGLVYLHLKYLKPGAILPGGASLTYDHTLDEIAKKMLT